MINFILYFLFDFLSKRNTDSLQQTAPTNNDLGKIMPVGVARQEETLQLYPVTGKN